jgi:hypothetical protein
MPQTSFSKLEKHSPTTLYMLYPMAQSVALFCIEIDKKMQLQWHCSLSSFIVTMEKQNHFGARPHLSVSRLAQPTTPQRANKTPYLQGTGAPRHYPHTLISTSRAANAWRTCAKSDPGEIAKTPLRHHEKEAMVLGFARLLWCAQYCEARNGDISDAPPALLQAHHVTKVPRESGVACERISTPYI